MALRTRPFTEKETNLDVPLQLAIATAERICDRVEWWIGKTPKSQRPRVRMTELKEFSEYISTLITELRSWQEKTLPRAAADLMTASAFESQMNYHDLYEAERKRNNKLSSLLLQMGTLMPEERILEELKKLDEANLDNFLSNSSRAGKNQ